MKAHCENFTQIFTGEKTMKNCTITSLESVNLRDENTSLRDWVFRNICISGSTTKRVFVNFLYTIVRYGAFYNSKTQFKRDVVL